MSAIHGQIELCRASQEMLPHLYRLLGEVFAPDRPLLERVLDGSVSLSHWEHFILCRPAGAAPARAACPAGSEILAHAALVPMRIWFERRLMPVAGIASVFTLPAWRRAGLARRVVGEALAAADRTGRACVLFTSLPRVYAGLGFRAVDQGYRRARASATGLHGHGHDFTTVTKLGAGEVERMRRIYEQSPYEDGKLERDAAIWPFYQAAFNGRDDVCVCFCGRGGETLGYVRLEREIDALLISELQAPAERVDVIEALLAQAFTAARSQDLAFVALALPEGHAAWRILAARGIPTASDSSASREHFMVRPPPAGNDRLSRLRWSLADKF